MKLSQLLLPYGCAVAGLCLLVTRKLARPSANALAGLGQQTPEGKVPGNLPGNVNPLSPAGNNRGSAQGFMSVRVAGGRNVMGFMGCAVQVRQAFSTMIQNYEMNGAMYVGNASDPQIPAALAPVISGIVCLYNFPMKSHARYVGDA